jgi:uncharacterized protein involved in exopolysaccharide biosynthesis
LTDTTRILDLRDYWQMIRTRMWTVVAMATIVAAIAGAYVALRPPTYFAQAKVIVEPLVNPAISGASGNSTLFAPDMLLEAEVVRSITIARAVRDSLGLATTPEQLAQRVKVEPSRETSSMLIGYLSSQPDTAATIANSFAEEYLAARKEKIDSLIAGAIEPLNDQIDSLRTEAGDLQADIEDSSDPQVIGDKRAALVGVEAQIAGLNERIAEILGIASTSQGGSVVQFAVAPRSRQVPASCSPRSSDSSSAP